jgi:putative membrane protein insertion efficiency factor
MFLLTYHVYLPIKTTSPIVCGNKTKHMKPLFNPLNQKNIMNKALSFTLLLPIYFYRMCISPLISPSCRFTPTCSLYAIEAIRKHGAFKGIYLAVRRILRCHPWGGSGYDPVPWQNGKLPNRTRQLSEKTGAWAKSKAKQTNAPRVINKIYITLSRNFSSLWHSVGMKKMYTKKKIIPLYLFR